MLKTAMILDTRKAGRRPLSSSAGASLRRIATTTALATGVVAGMMLFQPNAAQAQQVWTGPGTDWNTAGNWTPNDVPDTAGETAVFQGAIAPAALAVSAATTVGGVTYDAGAQGYTITVNNTLSITAAGVVNNSGVTQNFVIGSGQVLAFSGAATAGNNVVYTTQGNGGVSFQGTGSAAGASFVLGAGGNVFIQTANAVSLGSLNGSGASRVSSNTVGSSLTIGALNQSDSYSGSIQEVGAIGLTVTKTGTGTLTLGDTSGASNYTGLTTVAQGTLNIQANTALGTTAGGTTVAAGAALEVQGGIIVADALSLTGTGVAAGGALRSVSGANVVSGAITLAGNTSIVVAAGSLTISGGVTLGASALTVLGATVFNTVGIAGNGSIVLGDGVAASAVAFDVASSYVGGTTVNTNALAVVSVAGALGTGTVTLAGGSLSSNAAAVTVGNAITLTGNSFVSAQAAQTLTLTGGIALGGNTLDFNGAGSAAVTTAGITGAGGVTKSSTGTLTISAGGTYTGVTSVTGGVLNIQNNTALGATGVGNGTTVAAGAALQIQGNIVVGAEALTLNGAGVGGAGGALRNVSGANSYAGAITLGSDSRINSDAGTLTLSGGVTGASVLTVGGAGNTTISGAIDATVAGLTKEDAGTLTLSAAAGTNAYTGATTINGGTLTGGAANTFSNGSATTVNTGGTLNLGGFAQSIAAVSLAGGTLTNGTLTGAVTSTGGAISGLAGGATVTNTSGTTTFTGANAYTGATTINGGTVLGGAANALSNGSATTINATGTLDLGGFTQAVAAVSLAGGTLTNGTLTGAVASTGGTINNTSVTGGVTSTAGRTTVTGANTFNSTVNGGDLRVNGSVTGTVAVNAGGTLSGIGTVAGAVTINNGGTLSAGQSPGTLTVGSLTLNAGSVSNFELGTAGVSGGATNDLVIVNAGNLTINAGATLTASAASSGFYQLVTVTGGGTVVGNFTSGNITITGGAAGSTGTTYTNSPGGATQLNLVVLSAGQTLVLWDGADTLGNGTVDGGTGTWNSTNTNWTGATAGVNGPWQSSVGVFQGTAGTVTVVGTQSFDTLQFNVSGYTITGDALALGVAAGGTINTAANTTTTINSAVVNGAGSSLNKVGTGTLNLGGVNTYTGGTTVTAGTLGLLAGGVLASNVTVTSAGTFNNAGTVNASVSNAGALSTSGTIQNGVTNTGTVAASGVINGAIVNNAGSFTVAGALTGSGTFVNNGTATVAVTGGNLTGLTSFTNASTSANAVTVGAGRTLSATTISNTAGTFTSAGTVSAATLFSNSAGGTVNASGTITTAELRNSGSFTLTGATGGAITTLNNTAGGSVSVGSASFSGIGTLNNSGTVTIGSGSLSAATINNLSSFTSTGSVTASTSFSNSGAVQASGTITSPTVQNSASFKTTGSLQINGSFTNLSTGTLEANSGTLGISGTLSNAGRFTIADGLTANLGSLSNTGTVVLGRSSSVTTAGNLVNNGSIEARNGSTSNLITVGGGWQGNGNVGLDLDIQNAASDRIVVTGTGSSGSTAVNFALLSNGTRVLSNDILVVTGASGAQFNANNGLAANSASPFQGGGGQLITNDGGLVQYWFGETSPGSGNYVVRPDLNVAAASSFVASVSSALSSINAFSEPASAFISGPADPAPNTFSLGTWGRGRGGRFDITSNSIVGSPNGVTRSFRNSNEAGFSGFQLGIDAGLYNINGAGWSTNLGVHGGKVNATVTTPGTRLEVEQPFYGVYAAVRNSGGFAFDVLVRRDDFDLKLNSPQAGLTNTKFKADGWSGLASMTQRFNITDSIYIDPSIALLYSRAEVDTLRSQSVTVNWQPVESITGRAGVQIGTFLQPRPDIIVAPYMAFSVWREFAGATKADGQFGSLSFPTVTDRVGTYGQASFGVAVSSTTPGLSGFFRGDLRFGDRIEGYALNGGLRYQF